MPGGLAVDAQVAWLENYVRSLEARHNALSPEVRRQADAQDDAVRAARSYAEKEISKAVDDVRSEVRQLVGQDVGWEIGWLGVVAIGVVLSPFRPTCAPASRTYVCSVGTFRLTVVLHDPAGGCASSDRAPSTT
jgi:tetrahydromethanopterin S-methyltransferase subunit G